MFRSTVVAALIALGAEKAELDGRPVTPRTRRTNRGLEVTVETGAGTHTLVVTAGRA